jgi:hypothetical protein
MPLLTALLGYYYPGAAVLFRLLSNNCKSGCSEKVNQSSVLDCQPALDQCKLKRNWLTYPFRLVIYNIPVTLLSPSALAAFIMSKPDAFLS